MINNDAVKLCLPCQYSQVFLHRIICYAGGEDKDGSFSTVERYNPQNDTWCYVSPMIRKRAGCGVTACDGKIYVAGQLYSYINIIISALKSILGLYLMLHLGQNLYLIHKYIFKYML